MKKILTLLLLNLFFSNLSASDIKLEKIISGLKKPWSLSFIDENEIILTEKSGKLSILKLNTKETKKINHNLSILEDGQGGLLDVLYNDGEVFISYSFVQILFNFT